MGERCFLCGQKIEGDYVIRAPRWGSQVRHIVCPKAADSGTGGDS